MEPLDLSNLAERKDKSIFTGILPETHMNACFTCGTCSGGCPLTGMESTKDEGLDCRKAIRMAAFGLKKGTASWAPTTPQAAADGHPADKKAGAGCEPAPVLWF